MSRRTPGLRRPWSRRLAAVRALEAGALVPATLVPVFLVGAALAGCASTPTRFYALDPAPPASPPPPAARVLAVRVDAVRLPAGMERPEIVEEVAAHSVTVHDFAQWSAPLGEQARRVLTQDLAARLPTGAVVFPDAPKPPTGRGLSVDVLDVSRAEGRAVMDVSWTLTLPAPARAAGPPLAYTGRTLRLIVPSAGPGAATIPTDLSALLGRLADAMASDLASGR